MRVSHLLCLEHRFEFVSKQFIAQWMDADIQWEEIIDFATVVLLCFYLIVLYNVIIMQPHYGCCLSVCSSVYPSLCSLSHLGF